MFLVRVASRYPHEIPWLYGPFAFHHMSGIVGDHRESACSRPLSGDRP